MAIRNRYRPGDFLRMCARTGFTVYASSTKREWTGQIIRNRSFEPRNAQEFVRGVEDYQAVYDARPLFGGDNATDADGLVNVVGPVVTSVDGGHDPGATTLNVVSSTGMSANDTLRIALKEGNVQSVTLSSIASNALTITPPLSGTATTGNSVQDISSITTATDGF